MTEYLLWVALGVLWLSSIYLAYSIGDYRGFMKAYDKSTKDLAAFMRRYAGNDKAQIRVIK